MPHDITGDFVNIGSGNGLVPSGKNPLPEPILAKTVLAILRHNVTYHFVAPVVWQTYMYIILDYANVC